MAGITGLGANLILWSGFATALTGGVYSAVSRTDSNSHNRERRSRRNESSFRKLKRSNDSVFSPTSTMAAAAGFPAGANAKLPTSLAKMTVSEKDKALGEVVAQALSEPRLLDRALQDGHRVSNLMNGAAGFPQATDLSGLTGLGAGVNPIENHKGTFAPVIAGDLGSGEEEWGPSANSIPKIKTIDVDAIADGVAEVFSNRRFFKDALQSPENVAHGLHYAMGFPGAWDLSGFTGIGTDIPMVGNHKMRISPVKGARQETKKTEEITIPKPKRPTSNRDIAERAALTGAMSMPIMPGVL